MGRFDACQKYLNKMAIDIGVYRPIAKYMEESINK